jgi:pyruvate/2-oxoglutarate dehydrogenase complex dihydrolipoamide acyltransferase (E2) component
MVTAITSSLASVDYDAAVRLAYKSSAKTISFDVFKAKYLLETSAMVAKKNPYVAVADLTPMPSVASVDYDAAARLAYVASGKTEEYDSFKAKYLIETSAMVAKKNPYVSMADLTPMQSVVDAHTTEASVDYDAAARFAYAASGKTEEFDSFKAKYLSETSAMVAKKNPYAQAKPAPPTQEITAESFMKQPMVKVVKKMVKPKRNVPAASPLARLLAEELGLKLENIGMGSGKNGKILIDDVRMFQSKLQQAKNAIAEKQPYFATANA